MARPQHRTVHKPCPFGATNWADCDTAVAHQWGRCKALVDKKPEPEQCSRWAADDSGWCGQHYTSEYDRVRAAEREAKRKIEMNERIDAHIAMSQENPWWWLKFITPSNDEARGLPRYSDVKVQSADQEHRKDDPETDTAHHDQDASQVRHGKPPFRVDATTSGITRA